MAERPGIREALQWFTREKQWVNDIHLQLCRVPSPTFLEQQRAEWMAAQFRALGWHVGIDRCGNVLASGMDPAIMSRRVRVKCGRCRTVNIAAEVSVQAARRPKAAG